MSIPEYYLHMFHGVNGDHDQYGGGGRIAIASLMAGYGLTATTKRDLQTRVGWEATPGCFLGQREISLDSYTLRNRPSLKFLMDLVEVKKSGRQLNYTINWHALTNEKYMFNLNSNLWPVIARIYWMGKLMFGRNVIPEHSLALLKSRYTNELIRDSRSPNAESSNFHNPYLMQFFFDNRFFDAGVPRYVEGSYLPANELELATRLPWAKIMLSLMSSINPAENVPGFFGMCSYLPNVMAVGDSLGDMAERWNFLDASRTQPERGHNLPLTYRYGGYMTLGTPSVGCLTQPSNRFPNLPRDVVTLMFCRPDITPAEERQMGYRPPYAGFNTEVIGKNPASYVTAALLYEYRLLLTGEELFPLDHLRQARATNEWAPEAIIDWASSMMPLSNRNCTVGRLVKFNLDRQNRV